MSLLAVCVGFAACTAADPPIRVPDVQPIPSPMPIPPAPGTPLKLTPEVLFVVDSDIQVLVLTSPAGLVSVTEDVGPLRVRGRFVEDPTRTQTKTFSGKQVYTIEAVASGRCEVLIVPVGTIKASDVIRRTVDVEAGQGPQPPPDPKPPEPKPDDAPIKANGLHVLIVFESGSSLPAAQNSILYGKQTRDWLDANCVTGPDGRTKQYRIWDKDIDASGDSVLWAEAMKRPRKSVPWVIVSNGKTGFEGPLPGTVDEFLKLVKQYGGK